MEERKSRFCVGYSPALEGVYDCVCVFVFCVCELSSHLQYPGRQSTRPFAFRHTAVCVGAAVIPVRSVTQKAEGT